jgi:shikimate 5-dehydrogenase
VPNEAETPPKGPPPTQSTNINPAIMGLHYPEVGNGYIPGSSPQAMDDASAERAGGVQVTVPLKSAAPAPLPAPTNPAAP